MKCFGDKIEGIEYRDRVGAYAIIIDNTYRVATVKTKKGYFLLGGGLENDETNEECIKRECLEEAGLNVDVKKFVCECYEYKWFSQLSSYIKIIGNFYLVCILEKVGDGVELDHELVWISREEYTEKLHLEYQRWAVEKAFEIY